jgi:enoyl-CoA hydratase
MELLMTADAIDAKKAEYFGLVNKVVPHDKLIEEAKEMAKKIMSKGPFAIKAVIAQVNRGMQVDLASGLDYETELEMECFATEDAKEGLSAFTERRKAEFKGG